MATLKEYSSSFYPSREDLCITYATITFLKNEYIGKEFSNLDCSFTNVLKLIESRYQHSI